MSRATRRSASRLAAALLVPLFIVACGQAVPAAPTSPASSAAQPAATSPAASSAAQPAATVAPASATRKDTVVVAQSSTGANATTLDMAGVTGWFNEAFNIHEPLVKLEAAGLVAAGWAA